MRDRGSHRFAQRPLRLLALGQGANAMALLGQVDQVEIDAESAHKLHEAAVGLPAHPEQEIAIVSTEWGVPSVERL